MKMQNRLKILLILSLLLILTACVSTSTNNKEKKEQKNVTTKYVRDGLEISEGQVKREEEEIKKNLGYHEDIYTAIESSKIYPIVELKEVLKTVENDEKIIVYGVISYEKGFEQFTVMPLLKKKNEETGKVLYSEPWINARETYESYGIDWVKKEKHRYTHFQLLNYSEREDLTIPEKKNFQYFLLGSKEEAEKIKVNGHKPDEIIEHDVVDQELKKQKSYFVYFNDIEMSGGYDDMEITFE